LTNANLTGTDVANANFDDADTEYAILSEQAEEKVSERGLDIVAYARNVAKINLGDGVIVTTAQSDRTYEGEILSVHQEGNSKLVVMALGADRVIVHDMKDTDDVFSLEKGQIATLVTDSEGYSTVKGMDAESLSHAREGMRR